MAASEGSIDPTSPRQAAHLLEKHGLTPQKRLGQSFLCDRNTLDRIVRASDLHSDEPAFEIGAGLGALTLALADAAASVTAVEIDRHLAPILEEVTASRPNVSLVFDDFLRLDLVSLLDAAFGSRRGVVVANIPYYVTSPIVARLIEHKSRFRRITLLVQQEFARRMVASPGSDECGAMSLFVQYNARVTLVGVVPRTVFLPAPDVGSAIVTMEPLLPGAVPVRDEARMFHLIRAGFGQRRKTLLNALLRAPASFGLGFKMDSRPEVERLLELADLDGGRRGETLSLEEYARLSDGFERLEIERRAGEWPDREEGR
jgi:16S rRNA (adenine1518-N6/adenine1519-N6)-dimethyltransferase